ncbi:tRNA wybutosine-synthesizing protein 5-like isoform X2 [Lycorma delicatula]
MDKKLFDVEEYGNVTKEIFQKIIHPKRRPALLKNIDIGDCIDKWTPDYLIDKVGSVPVKVHVSNEGRMDFLKKNFVYKTLLFDDFIKLSLVNSYSNVCDSSEMFYYLRSLSNERRGKKVANIISEFPTISSDIKIPYFFDENRFFSSILRIGSSGVQVWTHYDVMDNMLIQIQGKKRVVLFSPSDAPYMYMEGDKSEVMDIDNPDYDKYPKFKCATRYECILEPGDVLFIPALWFHNTLAVTCGVNVNIFWKNLDDELYDKNDFYGNKDLLPAAKMLQMVSKAMSNLQCLPDEYTDFYAKRAIISIEKLLNKVENNDVTK